MDSNKQKQTETRTQYIGNYQQAPSYMKDNQSITHGYRINFNSPKKIFKSLFMLHNESVNIWTHLFPAIIIIVLISYFVVVPIAMTEEKVSNNSLNQNMNTYSQALHNLTEVLKLKIQLSSEQMHEMYASMRNGYFQFSNKFAEWKEELKHKMEHYQEAMRTSVKTKLQEFDQLKNEFEQVFAPSLIQKINVNSSYFERVKVQFEKLKTEIDSESYNFVEVGHARTPNPHQVSRWPIVIYLLSALTCLMGSTIYHLFYPMSGRTYTVLMRLDYAGINILIAGSSFPPLYYGMYCNLAVATIYLTLICMAGGIIFVISLFEWIHRLENANMKAFMYGGYGLSLSIPLTHLVLNQTVFNGANDASFEFLPAVPYYILCGASYLYGLYVYTARCPERKRPGKFNVCGHSHQIWHCFVVLGVIFAYIGVLQLFQLRKVSQCLV